MRSTEVALRLVSVSAKLIKERFCKAESSFLFYRFVKEAGLTGANVNQFPS